MVRSTTARLVALPPHDGVPGEFVLDRERLVIGRDPGSDLHLPAGGVSRRHAEVFRAGGRWLVRDLDSTNGTSVGGRPVTGPVALRDGDVLGLGDVRLLAQGLTGPPVDPAAVLALIPQPRGMAIDDGWALDDGWSFDDEWSRGDQVPSGPVDDAAGVHDDVRQAPGSCPRGVAATRTTARWLAGVGLALFVAGLVAGVYDVLVTFGHISAGIGRAVPPPDFNPLGGRLVPLTAFVDAAMIGGALLVIAGVELHLVATARRRRIDEGPSVPVPRPPSRP